MRENIDWISRALAIYLFRNGPIEDIHSSGKPLTEMHMETVNIYLVNRFAGILTALAEGQWLQVEMVLKACFTYANSWQEAQPDTDELDQFFALKMGIFDPPTELL